MSNYVMSDLHGCFDAYREMLREIQFSDRDMLYVLGDVLDRGPNPMKIVLDLMTRPNVVCLAGNHEYMALECLNVLLNEITDEFLDGLDADVLYKLGNWQRNGSASTLAEFYALDVETRKEVLEFLSEFELYEEVHVNGKVYILVHAGLGNFAPDRPLWEYELHELVWERPDYEKPYFSDKYVVTGHTPTSHIPGNPRPGYIYQNNRHIAIDCGAGFGKRLGCLCLETGEEFYVECPQ